MKFLQLSALALLMGHMYMNEAGDGTEAGGAGKSEEELAAEQAKADEKARIAAEKKAEKDAEKLRVKEEKAAARAEAAKSKKEAAEAKKQERLAQRIEQNGVSRPLTGSTKRIWEIADAISGETKAPAERAAVLERGKAEGLQEGTINTQYGRWRKYHGLTTVRELKPKAPPAAPAEGAEGGQEQGAE